MDLDDFRRSLGRAEPPAGLAPVLRALWVEARGDWDGAHALVQDETGRAAAAVHAYLHRKEGDVENADYWYERAGAVRPRSGLADEWEALVRGFLEGDRDR